MTIQPTVLQRLFRTIEDRKSNPPSRSYTAQLLAGGVNVIGAKILEESNELVEAAYEGKSSGREHLIHEAADVVYHLFVLLAYCEVHLKDLESELESRFGTSELDEKK